MASPIDYFAPAVTGHYMADTLLGICVKINPSGLPRYFWKTFQVTSDLFLSTSALQ
jgi:hypothetical protein